MPKPTANTQATAKPRPKPADQIVVIGSSAGGVDALSTLITTLPDDLTAPILIAQHLDPRRPSHLQEILARRTPLSVRTVVDHERLESGAILVVPSNRRVVITGNEVRLHQDVDGARPQPSVDLLLASAAKAFGEGVIAVILTGTGSDGAAGALAVKAAGGTVVIQNPETAAFPGMPESVAANAVDVVAELEEIGPLLQQLLADKLSSASDERALGPILDRVRERNGIDFGSYRHGTILRRLRSRMAVVGTPSLREYAEHLEADPSEYDRLSSSFLIKVTEFFRDPAVFEHVRNVVLPALLESAKGQPAQLRIWSAGCATGEETYSIAMLVADALDERSTHLSVRIFGTDLDADAVAFARRGIYPAAALGGLPSGYRDRFFEPIDDAYEVTKSVRALTLFGQHDLGQRAPFPSIDLILCRNVLMYFTPDLQERALRVFAFALRDGGRLVLGKAETVKAPSDVFAADDARLRVYRRQGSRTVLPPFPLNGPSLMSIRRVRATSETSQLDDAVARSRRDAERVRMSGEQADKVLLDLQIGVVVVRPRYEIVSINAAARRSLTIHGPAIGEDLVHQASALGATEFRRQIDGAFGGQSSTVVYTAATAQELGEERNLEVRCEPHRTAATGRGSDEVVIQISDVTASVEALAQGERQTARLARASESNRLLLTANEELSSSNALLRSTNDELLLSHEEVQASAEEIETLNEELQASNEELETLNEELQASLEELHTANTDLEVRSKDLQASTDSLSEERRRLAATLLAMSDAVIMVNERGEARLSNAAYQRLFSELHEDLSGEEDGTEILISEADLLRRAARGEHYRLRLTLADASGERRWYEVTGEPIIDDEVVMGGVVVVHDLTDLSLRVLQEEFVALVSHELRTPLTSLTGYLELLQRALAKDPADHDRVTRYSAQALRQSERLGQLVGDLLDASSLHRDRLQYTLAPFDLTRLVEETVDLAQPLADGSRLELTASTVNLTVNGDAGRLQQVLLNLLTNAFRHADAGLIEVSLRRRKDQAELRVRDDGRGIAAKAVPNLFNRYYQGVPRASHSGGGLGLGLFISKEIVTAHGGAISVRSRPGAGAAFTIRLPLHDAES